MKTTSPGSIRLFRVAGIDVFLHWSWFVVAVIQITRDRSPYSSIVWSVLEYLALFVIVLMHEFGHALACRQVGGLANKIVLWPLGGLAYIAPPPRPGPTLWSMAAGPLVNLVLVPILSVPWLIGLILGRPGAMPNVHAFFWALWIINVGLLIFNLLPLYPLDGGQILRCLLWFMVGRAHSLMVASIIGFAGVGGLFVLAVATRSVWFGILCLFMVLNCWGGLRNARILARAAAAPRRSGFACPGCRAEPPVGEFWTCFSCRKPFDTFATLAACPNCATQYGATQCMDCETSRPMSEWAVYVKCD